MFFFFKQKTAYEMRISDWSSDVCSSDLGRSANRGSCAVLQSRRCIGAEKVAKECVEVGRPRALDFLARENRIGLRLILAARDVGIERPAALRSEERRVGKEVCQYV